MAILSVVCRLHWLVNFTPNRGRERPTRTSVFLNIPFSSEVRKTCGCRKRALPVKVDAIKQLDALNFGDLRAYVCECHDIVSFYGENHFIVQSKVHRKHEEGTYTTWVFRSHSAKSTSILIGKYIYTCEVITRVFEYFATSTAYIGM